MSAPLYTPVDDDLDQLHAEKTAKLAQAEIITRWKQRLSRPPGEAGVPRGTLGEEAGAGAESAARPQRSLAGRMARDVGRGGLEAAPQIAGGALDAVREVGDMAREFNSWVSDTLGPAFGGGIIVDEGGIRLASGEEIKATPTLFDAVLPEIHPPRSTTGSLVRNVSKFVTGFVGAGKIPALHALSEAAPIAGAFARGAIADFSVFDPHQERLSNLIQKVPALRNPVTEYLAADPSDSAAEGRLKNAAEGLGLGLMTEGFVRGVRLLRAARAGKAAEAAAQAADVEAAGIRQLTEKTQAQRARLTEMLGDPEAPRLEIRPIEFPEEEAAKALATSRTTAETPQDVFVNWSRIDSPDDVKAVVQDLADAFKPEIDAARRGVRTHVETKLAAEDLDAWKTLADRRIGEPLGAEQSLAVRELWVRSGKQVRDLAQQVVADPSELNKLAFRKSIAIHNAIQEQVVAARTETARALNAWKIPAGDTAAFAGQMDELRSLLAFDDVSEEMARRVTMLSDAGLAREADALLYGSPWAKTKDMVTQLYYASMLSGPHTHARNVLSNMGTLGQQLLERKAANLMGKATGSAAIPDGETTAMAFGALQGFRDAFRISSKGRRVLLAAAGRRLAGQADEARRLLSESADEFGTFYRAAATGESGIGVGKVELPRLGAFSPEKIGVGAETPIGRVLSLIDTGTTMPTRALSAADEIFKSAAFRMELNARAFRMAHAELAAGKITREQFPERLAAILSQPDESMRLAARSFAEVSTFTQTPLPTKAWSAWQSIGNVPVLGKLMLPFRRTPFNLATYAFQRTPLAPFVKQWREDVLAGGARGDLAWSKFLLGNATLLTLGDLAAEGRITGEGPADPRERETLKRMGWQPNSVKVGDRYYSYRGLEPIATSLGLAANTVEILAHTDWEDPNAQSEELVIASTMALASQAISAQYMMGVSDFMDAMSDPRRYAPQWWKNRVALLAPTGLSTIETIGDPTMREAYTLADAIRARTPGLSKNLPPQRDLWGRPVTRASGLGSLYDAMSPIYSKEADAEPIDAELNRLETWIGKPSRRTSFEGVSVNLERSPRIYDRYVELAGNVLSETRYGAPIVAQGFVSQGGGAKDELNALVSGRHPGSALYERLSDGPDGGKAKQIEAIVEAYRDAARDQLLVEFPELEGEVAARRAEQPTRFAP
jgi:hypothetical protein